MGENKFAGHIAKDLENELASFLNLSWIEKLEKAEEFFQHSWNTGSYEKSQKISLMFKELADSYKQFLENASEEYKEFSQNTHSQYLYAYLDEQFQDLICRLPYYFLFTHIICDETYHQISYEKREELREICGLQKSKDRRDAFTNLFSFLIRDKISQGGSEGFWNEANSLYFISWYNRFQIVIKNARKDLEKRKDTPDARRKILEKYEIPQEYENTTFSKKDFKPSELALDWALKLIGCDIKDATKALKTAREKAGKHKTYNSKKLISVYKLNLNLGLHSIILSPKARSDLRFRDFRVNDFTMLYYI
jgi:hypothetical protein